MKIKKILFFTHSMWESRWTEKLFWQLSHKLDKNYEIFFVAFYDITPYIDFSWKYIFLNENKKGTFLSYIKNMFLLRKIIKENNIDLIIWTNDFLNIFLLFSIIFLKIKKIWTIHSNPLLNFNNIIKRYIIKFLYPFFYKIICVSKEQENIMKDKFWLKNTQVIYNFFDIENEKIKFNEQILNLEENIFKNKFNFLIISRLDKLKGFLPTLRVFKELNKKYNNINLIIIWEWDYRKNIEKYILDNNLTNNIHLLWSKKNIYPYLLKSDCFLFPSLTEAFWLVLIEALLANKIIISSDCSIWPKEILNINSSFKINKYPYYADYWVLIESFTLKDLEIYNLEWNSNLIEKEKKLFKLLEDVYLNKNKYSAKYFNWNKRAESFDINNIVQDWKNLLW